MAQHCKVLIIGAGISGLAAAEKLQEKGITDYLILEATDRIGGRIKTLKQNQDGQDYFLELGAGWIHGKKNNPIYKLADKNNLIRPTGPKPTDPRLTVGNIQYMEEGNNIIGKKVWKEVKGLYLEAIDAADELFTKESLDDNDMGTRTFIEEHVKQNLDQKDKEKYRKRLKVLETLIGAEAETVGCQDLSEVSAYQVGSYMPEDNVWTILPRGYEEVIKTIKAKIPDNILFDHAVSNISLNLEGSAEKACSITCENGKIYSADYCIITASLGFLKENGSNLFTPPLSEEKMSAIEKLGFGTANRIYVEFENLDFIKEKTLGEIFLVKDPKSNDESWTDGLYSFYCQEVPRVNILTTWTMGNHAIAIEKLSDDEVKSKLQEVLQKYLKVPVPIPTRIIRTAWKSEPYFCGSWTFIKLGSCVKDIKALAEPIKHKQTGQPILLFAGEATHKKYYSSTPGAYLSGQREANRLIRIISN